MRRALAVVVLLLPSLAAAETASEAIARMRADRARRDGTVASTSATATGLVGSSSRVLANSGCTASSRPACGSRGILLDSRSKSSRSTDWRDCDRRDRGHRAPVRSCGGSGDVVVAPTVIVVVGGGVGEGTWATSTSGPRMTGTWGWGGGTCGSRPADVRVSWQAAPGRR